MKRMVPHVRTTWVRIYVRDWSAWQWKKRVIAACHANVGEQARSGHAGEAERLLVGCLGGMAQRIGGIRA